MLYKYFVQNTNLGKIFLVIIVERIRMCNPGVIAWLQILIFSQNAARDSNTVTFTTKKSSTYLLANS